MSLWIGRSTPPEQKNGIAKNTNTWSAINSQKLENLLKIALAGASANDDEIESLIITCKCRNLKFYFTWPSAGILKYEGTHRLGVGEESACHVVVYFREEIWRTRQSK